MIVCPWCGTNYATFQSNCKNCGGPIQLPAAGALQNEVEDAASLLPPPAAPREISNTYAWKLMMTEAASIAGFVFTLIGSIFSMLGLGLTLGFVTIFIGLPFLVIGLTILLVGGALLYWRYREAQKVVDVLRWGEAACGQVTDLQENLTMVVNNRHPWTIAYQFSANGQAYTGKVTTLNIPGRTLQPGRQAYVLYMPGAPQQNALYPHP